MNKILLISTTMVIRMSMLLIVLCIFLEKGLAAKTDTIETYSVAMNKKIKAIVITPDSYGDKALPVLYLLHGHGGSYADWLYNAPAIKEAVDLYQFIIVCADGGVSSWYWDSLVDTGFKYETYISSELVNWIDRHYKTIAHRNGRAIAGMSMGGQGAFFLAFRHQEVYGAAGSVAGGVDIRPFSDKWNINGRLGPLDKNRQRWDDFSVINLVHLLKTDSLALMMDCGTEDFFYEVNMNLHNKLLEMKIPHDFITRPGVHKWEYGRKAIPYQLLFFHSFFSGRR